MSATLRLPSVFSSHMVLQRDLELPIWGWASPGQTISIEVAGQRATTTADSAGRWAERLSPLPAGGPHEVVVIAGDESIRIDDVLFGDVWLCSGQSNMEFALEASTGGLAAVTEATHPTIRLLNLPRVSATAPSADIQVAWAVCSPLTARAFSAVGYYFGREIHQQIGVPIGLINASWGGTPAEAWMPVDELTANPEFAGIVARLKESGTPKEPEPHADPGNQGVSKGWANADFDDSSWSVMDVPGSWESQGLDIDGAVWFRRDLEVPPESVGPLTLDLGVVDDFDVTYFNGKEVGSTGLETPNWWTKHRRYQIPAELVRPGRNSIAVRVFDQWSFGGLLGPEENMSVTCDAKPEHKIPLSGDWKYKVELALPSISPGTQSQAPASLYNGMLSPLIPFGIAGVIWYQGESNADRAAQYRKLFVALIRSWRRCWEQGDFPFLFVQLPNFLERSDSRKGSPWADLREAQTLALALPNTGQAVTIDLGDPDDIHPRNKRDVGLRLANEALRLKYGRSTSRSPMCRSFECRGSDVKLEFAYADGGLVIKGDVATGFAIAAENGIFHPAAAIINGSTVTLSSDLVPKPVAARYGWASNPACNVYNHAGLPVCPFRTDRVVGTLPSKDR